MSVNLHDLDIESASIIKHIKHISELTKPHESSVQCHIWLVGGRSFLGHSTGSLWYWSASFFSGKSLRYYRYAFVDIHKVKVHCVSQFKLPNTAFRRHFWHSFFVNLNGIEHWVEIGLGLIQAQFSQNEQRMMNHYRLRFPTLQRDWFNKNDNPLLSHFQIDTPSPKTKAWSSI